jgi:hypothetical protein
MYRKPGSHARASRAGQQKCRGHEDPMECSEGLLVFCLDNGFHFRDADYGQEIRTLKGPVYPIYCVAITRDGKRIVSGYMDLNLWEWEMTTLPNSPGEP